MAMATDGNIVVMVARGKVVAADGGGTIRWTAEMT